MATGFGRKGMMEDDLAARRAAFIASERERAARAPADEPIRPASRYTGAGRAKTPVYAEEKTLFVAYTNWFLLGSLGAHRFYLGYTVSGAVQAMIGISGLVLLFQAMTNHSLAAGALSMSLIGTLMLWLIGDLVVIPSMCERANAKLRRAEAGRKGTLD